MFSPLDSLQLTFRLPDFLILLWNFPLLAKGSPLRPPDCSRLETTLFCLRSANKVIFLYFALPGKFNRLTLPCDKLFPYHLESVDECWNSFFKSQILIHDSFFKRVIWLLKIKFMKTWVVLELFFGIFKIIDFFKKFKNVPRREKNEGRCASWNFS